MKFFLAEGARKSASRIREGLFTWVYGPTSDFRFGSVLDVVCLNVKFIELV